MASNLSLEEIMKVLQKSGAMTDSNSFDMGQNKMNVEQNVRSNIMGSGNPALEAAKSSYLAQLAKIAEMDSQLAGVYGDPTSPLYIERASRRDTAVHMADAPNYKAATVHADLYEQKKKELEDSIKQTMAVYSELAQLQKQKESEAATKARNEERVKAGKGKYVTTETGQQIVTPVYKGRSGSGLTTTQEKKYNEAGLDYNNEKIRAVWNNSPDGFKNWFTEQRATGKIKDKEITPDELGWWRNEYKKVKAKETVKAAAEKKNATIEQRRAARKT